ncbi:MAG: type II secretion system major pseudopilin GspG [Pseudomonadota bacterium]
MRALLVRIACCLALLGVMSTATAHGKSRVGKAAADIRAMESALGMYERELGTYPTTEEGLEVLVEPPRDFDCAGRPLRFMDRIPRDPWNTPYQYRYPGVQNQEGFDLWTLGADGAPGGTGINGDYGNWGDGMDTMQELGERSRRLRDLGIIVLFAAAVGLVMGLPVYATGYVLRLRAGGAPKAAATGFHLGVLVYLTLSAPAVALVLGSL